MQVYIKMELFCYVMIYFHKKNSLGIRQYCKYLFLSKKFLLIHWNTILFDLLVQFIDILSTNFFQKIEKIKWILENKSIKVGIHWNYMIIWIQCNWNLWIKKLQSKVETFVSWWKKPKIIICNRINRKTELQY